MRTRINPDRLATILGEIRADLDAALNVDQSCREAGVNPTTSHRRKALQSDPVSNERLRMGELEAEVGRLKPMPA